MTAKSEKDIEDWVEAIQRTINLAAVLKVEDLKTNVGALKGIQKGFMEMKNKKWFFSIGDGCLSWFEHETGQYSILIY